MSEENELQEVQEESVEQEEVTEASEDEQSAEQEAAEEEKPTVSPGVQKRIDQITRKRYEEARAREDAERRAQELEARLKQYEQPQKPQGRPKLEDFNYDEEKFYDALTDWKLEQRDAKAQRVTQEEKQRQKEAERKQHLNSVVDKTLTLGYQSFKDYDEVVVQNPLVTYTEEMVEIIGETEIPHEISYFLGKNPEESNRIAQLPERAQAREIGKIEAALSTKQEKKTTKAPPPVKPVGSRGSKSASIEPNLEDGRVNPAWVKARNEGKL